MLGLGTGITYGNAIGGWSPESVARPPTLWFRRNSGIISSESTDGTSYSPSRTSELGNLSDEDKITEWQGQGGTTVNFQQTTAADMPRFETDAADLGALAFPQASKFMDLIEAGGSGTTANFTGQFTMLVHCRPTDLSTTRALLADSDTEFLRFGGGAGSFENTIRMKIDNNAVNFTNSGANFTTTEYVSIMVIRDENNLCKLYVYSNTHSSVASGLEWGGETTQAGTVSISNLGCQADDSTNFQGFIATVVVWAAALEAEDRTFAFEYARQRP
jgi:hypothetical protein